MSLRKAALWVVSVLGVLLLLLAGVIACRIAYFKSAGYTQTFTVSEADK